MHAPDEGNPSISQCQHAPHVANQRCGGFGPAPVIGKLECSLVSRRNYNFASLGGHDAFFCGAPKVIKATSCCTDSKAGGDIFWITNKHARTRPPARKTNLRLSADFPGNDLYCLLLWNGHRVCCSWILHAVRFYSTVLSACALAVIGIATKFLLSPQRCTR